LDEVKEHHYHSNPHIFPESWNPEWRPLHANNDFSTWWPCDVLEADDDNELFKVKVYDRVRQKLMRHLHSVPRESIKFVEKPYHSDMHLLGAFRHYIPVPDAMFPFMWKNNYIKAEDLHLGKKNTGVDVFGVNGQEILDNYKQALHAAECGVYLAQSGIANSGRGIYVGVGVPAAEMAIASSTAALPIITSSDSDAIDWDINNYNWGNDGNEFVIRTGDNIHMSFIFPGFGTFANSHEGLVNARIRYAEYLPMLDRCEDPGAGAFSDYFGSTFISTRVILAGEEVFISYGPHW